MSAEDRHPIVKELLALPFQKGAEKRALNAVWRAIEWYSRQPRYKQFAWAEVATWDYARFLAELVKPNGGLVGQIPNVGVTSIAILRRVCIATSVEYGYA